MTESKGLNSYSNTNKAQKEKKNCRSQSKSSKGVDAGKHTFNLTQQVSGEKNPYENQPSEELRVGFTLHNLNSND